MSKTNLTDRAITKLVPPSQGRVEVLDGIMARGTEARPNRTHANRVRALVHALFAFGVRRDLLTANPVDGVERQLERPRDKVLTADEVRAIFEALEDEAAAMQSYVRL